MLNTAPVLVKTKYPKLNLDPVSKEKLDAVGIFQHGESCESIPKI
jgi:hypothetical protein